MANGEGIIQTVKDLLSEDRAITQKTAQRLTLEMMLELHKAVKFQENSISDTGKKLDIESKRLDALERKSIICWIERHPKLAIFVITLTIILTAVVDLRVILAKALGIDL